MKKSSYNIFVHQEHCVICFNSFTNTYVVISKKAHKSFTNEEIGVFAKHYPKQYCEFVKSGFIIEKGLDELSVIRYNNKVESFTSRKYHLMVFPTQDCNLKCWYCYESHKKDSLMEKDIIDKVIANVKLKLKDNSFDSLFLSFFGGEPLINFDSIAYPIASTIKRFVEEKGKKFTCFFVTNASLINSGMIEKFKEIKPKFQITLDGNREKHNKVRIWKKGDRATYDTIIEGIHKIAESVDAGNLSITLRINYDNQTLKNITDIIEDLKGIDKTKIYMHFERVWQTQSMVNKEQQALLRKTLQDFTEEGFIVNQGIFRSRSYACPAETNSYAIINYDGSVHKCNGRTLSVNTKEGELMADGVINWDTKKISKRIGLATFENPMCLGCKMLPLCMGPCSQKLLEHGKINKDICSLKSVDTSLDEYLLLDFESKFLAQKYSERAKL